MSRVEAAVPSPSHRARWARAARTVAVAVAVLAAAPAPAHVGVVNTQLPFAVAGKSYELVLAVPHGCAYTAPGAATPVELDTYKVEVLIPAGFTGVRPIIDGVFGRPVITRDAAGAVTSLTWTKNPALDSEADDQSYRVAVRSTAPNAPFTAVQFGTKQSCKRPGGGEDVVVDWTAYPAADGSLSNQSPTVRIHPARQPGWNKFNLAATNEKHTQADVAALLSGYLADAQIVWVGKGAYSANPNTLAKIRALAVKDATYFELAAKADVMIHAVDDIWVKF